MTNQVRINVTNHAITIALMKNVTGISEETYFGIWISLLKL